MDYEGTLLFKNSLVIVIYNVPLFFLIQPLLEARANVFVHFLEELNSRKMSFDKL